MDYSSVAPPSSAPGDQNTAFADALARAKQIAAKIGGSTTDTSLKRPYDGVGDGQPDPKKMAAINDPIGAQLKAIADQQRAQQTQQAVQAAASAAAQINAKLGIQSQPGPPVGGEFFDQGMPSVEGISGNGFGNGGIGAMPGGLGGMVTTENFAVPDRMVGLVIGKGGENIAMIQSETGVKVQFAQDSGGMPDRPCTLTGAKEGIEKAKELINKIIQKGSGLPDCASGIGDNVVMEEVMIPGSKVGLVIGKGGENIKMLQERANVKMVMIQDSNIPSHQDKPLRITGEPDRVAQAKEMVFDLLAEKEAQSCGFGGGKHDMCVPRALVGVVIGKGGEMIKKITTDTGARVQLKPDDGNDPERICQVTGSPDQVDAACKFIHSLLENANRNQMGGGPGGAGRGRGRGGSMERGPGGRDGQRPGGAGGFGSKETTFIVPADKTGLVIGKGGEYVKEIHRATGCWVELSRDRPPNPHDRVFMLSGQPDQIQRAIGMICDKAGLPIPPNGPGGGPPGPGGFGGGGGPGGPGGFNPGMPHQGGPGPQQPGGPPQGWGTSYPGNHWNQPQAPPQEDPNKQAADANAAAWAAYYQNYGAYGQPQQQQAPQQPPAQPQQPAPYQQQQQQQPAATPGIGAPTVNPVTGQPDYSMAWAEYYRQQGMHAHAQAILQQAQQQQQPQQFGQPGGGGQPPQ